jgi:hypothetical protein
MQKKYYDLHVKPLKPLQPGANILIKKGKIWEPAQVESVHSSPRSYIIRDQNNTRLRRNRRFLTESVNPPPSFANPEIEADPIDPTPTPNVCVSSPEKTGGTNAIGVPPTMTRSGRMVIKPHRYRD